MIRVWFGGLIVSALKHGLAEAGHRASTTVSSAALGAMRPADTPRTGFLPRQPAGSGVPPSMAGNTALAETAHAFHRPLDQVDHGGHVITPSAPEAAYEADDDGHYPLGVARAQLHETYIVAQTDEGIVIVDQHAAHERLVYEEMKKALAAGGIQRQALLIPEVVELDEARDGENSLPARKSWPSWDWWSNHSVPAPWWCAKPRRGCWAKSMPPA